MKSSFAFQIWLICKWTRKCRCVETDRERKRRTGVIGRRKRRRTWIRSTIFNKWDGRTNADEHPSTFSLQYIQQSIRRNPSDIDFILQAPDQQDEGVWKYEHLRQFCLELNDLTVLLQVTFFVEKTIDSISSLLQKECLPQSCSQMTATEQWIFLCAAHKNPKEVMKTLVIRSSSLSFPPRSVRQSIILDILWMAQHRC